MINRAAQGMFSVVTRTPSESDRITAFDYASYAFLTGAAPSTELVLVRHGQQDHPGASRPFVENRDPPLSDTGRRQAEAVGRRFADQQVDVVYSSDLTRARATGQAVAGHHGLAVIVMPALREVEILRDVPADRTLEDHFGPVLISGLRERMMFERSWDVYPGGESSAEFRQRVVTALEGIATSHPGSRVVVACHGGVINAYLAHHLGIAADLFFRPAHTAVNVMVAGAHGVRAVRTIGDVHHLDATPDLVTY